ncbi:MAG: hypothetical protein KGN74_06775 [Gemmatimonadota bacterium]|nr:hypothetical protein [Gemmatimonadota bacterium]
MRTAPAWVLLVFLAACGDQVSPTATPHAPRAAAATARAPLPNDHGPMLPGDSAATEAVPVLSRVAALMVASLTNVAIPPDGYSHAPDAVHPDVACAPGGWNGARCWLAYTPYLQSNAAWENPSFLVGASDTGWAIPAGVSNPVVPWPGGRDYNSDPDQVFDPATGRLVTFYRKVDDAYNNILVTSSADGRRWRDPQLAFQEPNHDAVSPAVVLDPGRRARMWYVRSGTDGCRAQRTRVSMRTAEPGPHQPLEDATWSDAMDVRLSQPGFVVWHMDVIALPEWQSYLALLVSHAVGNDCASDDLWLAMSVDGARWQVFPVPVLWRLMPAAKQLRILSWYRGTMRYDAATDSLHLWPSALTADNRWFVYHTAVKFTDLVRLLLAATPADQPHADLVVASRVSAAIRRRMP